VLYKGIEQIIISLLNYNILFRLTTYYIYLIKIVHL